MINDDQGLEVLDEDECLHLLQIGWLGRIAVNIGAVPAVFPVNYGFADNSIFFKTGEGVKFRAAVDGTVVAFEVDDVDPTTATGWSVLAVGPSSIVENPEEIARANEIPMESWAPGLREAFVRIDPIFISGRRINP